MYYILNHQRALALVGYGAYENSKDKHAQLGEVLRWMTSWEVQQKQIHEFLYMPYIKGKT